ncbi:MAG: hypothetical protein PT957_04280 [Firmicutes bacterium]|nr:hypothetical protein [Bacillota bacterium]
MPGNEMMFSVSLNGLLLAVLIVVAIVALVYLIKVLAKASKAVDAVSELLEKNKEELDAALKTIPTITGKTDQALGQVSKILDQSSPDIVDTISGAKDTVISVSRLTTDAADTVEYLAATAIDTADSLSSGVTKTNSTLGYVREIAKIVKDVIGR